jgi:tRNA(Ile)-lysidine synthase
LVQDKLKNLVVHKWEVQQVPVLLLQKCKGISTILFYWLRAFGFHAGQSGEAMKLLNAETGRFIESASHRLFKNRQWLLLVPKPAAMGTLVVIDEGQSSVDFDNRAMRITVGNGSPVPTPEAEIALIDAMDISFPLILRPWKTGDYFYPLGMNKKKKLSRFFIDNKLSIAAKEKVWVLESDKKIIWVVGYRIDNRFKLKPTTNQWIRFELLPSK